MFASSDSVPLMPVMVKTAPTNRLPLSAVVNWSAPRTGSITLVRVTVILLPLWPVTVYTVPTGPDRLFDGEGAALVLARAAGAVLAGAGVLVMLPQPAMASTAAATARVAIFIDLPP